MQLEWLAGPGEGEGHPTPMLFVHGACHGAWCWQDHFLPYFSKAGWRTFALSLRGHGGSPGREGLRWYSTRDYLDDIREGVRRCGRSPVLVGHSMGARLVQIYAARFGAAAVILLAPPPPCGILPSVTRLFVKMPRSMILNHLFLTWRYVSKHAASARRAFFHASLSDDVFGRHLQRLGDEAALAYGQMFLPLRPSDRRRNCPAMVIGAANDEIFTPAEVTRTARLLGAEFKIIPDAAHDLMLDPHWELAARAMRKWLEAWASPAEPRR